VIRGAQGPQAIDGEVSILGCVHHPQHPAAGAACNPLADPRVLGKVGGAIVAVRTDVSRKA
jgi:hypothetical protein